MAKTINAAEKMKTGFEAMISKLIVAPTLTKNTAKSKPLNGSILLSNSWRNSLFANITPAMNAPKAGLKPMEIISSETPITRNNDAAVKSSFNPDFETNLRNGMKMYRPNKIKAKTAPITVNGCNHSGM